VDEQQRPRSRRPHHLALGEPRRGQRGGRSAISRSQLAGEAGEQETAPPAVTARATTRFEAAGSPAPLNRAPGRFAGRWPGRRGAARGGEPKPWGRSGRRPAIFAFPAQPAGGAAAIGGRPDGKKYLKPSWLAAAMSGRCKVPPLHSQIVTIRVFHRTSGFPTCLCTA